MIDLHTHTNESDGSLSPSELLVAAQSAGLRAFAITDHDTFSGYSQAREPCESLGMDLICGIEISSRDCNKPVHVLGYFLAGPPPPSFEEWLTTLAAKRMDRNRRIAERLRTLGLPVLVEEAEGLGRSVTGRVHFARLLMRKGFTRSIQEGFTRYLGESAPGYVEADDPSTEVVIGRVRDAGGLPVLAHAARYEIHDMDVEDQFFRRLTEAGLAGLEVIHTDHEPHDVVRYSRLAERYRLLVTGGSDFHGEAKSYARLGYGNYGQQPVPPVWLDRLREAATRS